MSEEAVELEIEDVTPPAEAPVAEPAEAIDTPTPEPKETPTDPSPAPTEKVQQQEPQNHWIPKWRFDEVNEQLKQLRQQPQQPINYQVQQPGPDAPVQPKEENYPTWEAFRQAEKDYFRAEASYQARQAIQDHQQQFNQAQQFQALRERVEKAETDWNSDLYAVTQKNPALIQKLQNAPSLRPELQLVLKESKARVALAEHLADNPALVLQINRMPQDQAMRTMIEAEFKLTAANGGPQKKPSAQVPNLDPVGGGSRPAKKNPYSADASVEDFIFGTARLPAKQ